MTIQELIKEIEKEITRLDDVEEYHRGMKVAFKWIISLLKTLK